MVAKRVKLPTFKMCPNNVKYSGQPTPYLDEIEKGNMEFWNLGAGIIAYLAATGRIKI